MTDEVIILREIAAERARQVHAEGWTHMHDDSHPRGELLRAALAYRQHVAEWMGAGGEPELPYRTDPPMGWPWAWRWWKPKNPRADLIRAGALIVAEQERAERMGENDPSFAAELAWQLRLTVDALEVLERQAQMAVTP